MLDNPSLPRFDLVYLDPPFGTQKNHSLVTRDGSARFEFKDIWRSQEAYGAFLYDRLIRIRRLVADTGSIFLHCDAQSSHVARLALDSVFGSANFQAEIIWAYRRWSNARKGLLPSHQNILFYSATKTFKFNPIFTDYSETTNTDQILQLRARDGRGKAVYARGEDGSVIHGGAKHGVPLGDVWEIPFLNPKASERVGYPTQKPILLLERIISLVTDEGDWVLDPFCGSGSTLVAARLNRRNAVGIDILPEAVRLTRRRLERPVRTSSKLLARGRAAYRPRDAEVLGQLRGVDFVPVARNRGIDAILKAEVAGRPVFVRVQRATESLADAATALRRAARRKGQPVLVVIQTAPDDAGPGAADPALGGVEIVRSAAAGLVAIVAAGQPAEPARRTGRVRPGGPRTPRRRLNRRTEGPAITAPLAPTPRRRRPP